MELQATKLAADYGVDPSDVYAYQYLFAKGPDRFAKGLRHIPFGKWSLSIGKSLPAVINLLDERRIKLVFLGIGVDADGAIVSAQTIQDKWAATQDIAQVIAYLNACAGRYVFGVFTPDFSRLYGDACGSLAIYTNKRAKLVGCSQFLVLDRPLDPNTDYPAYEQAAKVPGYSFAFTQTADRKTRQVLANHYVDLESYEQTRFWPTEDDDFSCPTNIGALEQRVDAIVARHRQVIGALASHFSPCFLPLSGGSDSRTLLAFATPHLSEIDCFVHIMGWTTRNDAFVARSLAASLDIPLKVIDYVKQDEVRLSHMDAHRMALELGLAQGLVGPAPERREGMLDVTAALPKGGIVLRGQVINISKGYHLTRQAVEEFCATGGHKHNPNVGLKALNLHWDTEEQRKYYAKRYRAWFNTLPHSARIRAVDMALVEQHRAHSMGRFFNIFTRNFYIIPSNDRAMVQTMIQLPPNLRHHLYIHDMILERANADLAAQPYNPLFADHWRKLRHQDSLTALLGRLPERV